MISLSTFLLIAFASAATTLPTCERPCPKNLMPVCGFDGEHHKLFDNECVMQNEHCFNGRTWVQIRMNECLFGSADPVKPNCKVPCNSEFRPVCGFDGSIYKTFMNPCLLKNQYCKDGHQWFEARMAECDLYDEEQEKKRCSTDCPRNFEPTCGVNGKQIKIFENPCMLEHERCESGTPWVQSPMADCLIECPETCIDIYAPVCGFNGIEHVVFDNECYMRARNCGVKVNRFIMVKPSECH